MGKNNNFKLNVLSYIADDILNICTAARLKMLNRKKKSYQKIVIPSVCAAMLALVMLSVFVVALLRSNIPVYRGMSLSSDNPGVAVQASKTPLDIALLKNDTNPVFEFANKTANYSVTQIDQNNDKHSNKYNKDTEAVQTKEPVMHTSPGAQMFYTKPNEDFYITVHIDNPKNYEIVSFTLNGKKYSSYMFENGSDMENLILKCNVGDASGFVEYTIDAIKYIDGTTIKDVILKGEQTVIIGVDVEAPIDIKYDNIQEDYNSVSFDMSFEDPLGLLDKENGRFIAYLYCNEVMKSQTTIDASDTSVKFDGIADGNTYLCKIFAIYDAKDGQGETEHLVKTIELSTKARFTITFRNISCQSAEFRITPKGGFDDITLSSAAVYKDQKKVADIDLSKNTVTGLDHNTDYVLKIEYSLSSQKITKEAVFKTMEATVPAISISDLVSTPSSVSVKLNIDDPSGICKVQDVKLMQGEKEVATAKLAERYTFTDLELLKSYQLHVTYSYDLNDGKGVQQKTFVSCSLPTQSAGLDIELIDRVHCMGIGSCTDEIVYVNSHDMMIDFKNSKAVFLVIGPDVVEVNWDGITRGNNFKYVFVHRELLVEGSFIYDYNEYASPFPGNVIMLTNAARSSKTETLKGNWVFDYNPTNIYKASNGVVYGILNGKKTALMYLGKDSKVVIEDSTEVIGPGLFYYSKIIEEVVFPSSVERIESSAFKYCNNLKIVNLPNSLEYIGAEAFNSCEAIEMLDLPNSVKYIGEGAFRAMINLKSITLPAGITEISNYMFLGCENLESINIPQSVAKIGKSAFGSCSKLSNLILPDNLKYIEQNAFNTCSSLGEMTLPKGLVSIGSYAFRSCRITVHIPDSVVTVGRLAFANCTVYVPFASMNECPSGWDADWSSDVQKIIYNTK